MWTEGLFVPCFYSVVVSIPYESSFILFFCVPSLLYALGTVFVSRYLCSCRHTTFSFSHLRLFRAARGSAEAPAECSFPRRALIGFLKLILRLCAPLVHAVCRLCTMRAHTRCSYTQWRNFSFRTKCVSSESFYRRAAAPFPVILERHAASTAVVFWGGLLRD